MAAIVENYAVADVDVIFHDVEEACTSTHVHKVAIDGAAATQKLAATLQEMQALSKKLATKEGATSMRNAAVHCLVDYVENPASIQLPVASSEITAEINAAMPAKNSPTSLGSAALEPGEKEELKEEQLEAFLKLHDLLHMKDMEGIGWRSKKL